MSETTDTAAPPELEPKPGEQQPEPQPEPEPKPEAPPEAERRYHRLTARLNTLSRERDELAARLVQLEQARQQQPGPMDPNVQAHIQAEAQRLVAAQARNEHIRTFHEKGAETYPDWEQKTSNLMAMGADPGFAELLIELPQGHKVAASLADEPDELDRIVQIKTERGRAIALGQYAQRISNRPVRPVSKAPTPPPTVEGRAAPTFDETTADAQTLVNYYMKQSMEQRANRR